MNHADQTDTHRREYLNLVRTLFEARKPLWQGLLSFSSVFMVVYIATWDPVYLVGFVLALSICAARLRQFALFDREDCQSMSVERARRWELRYILGGTAATLNMSLLTGYSFIMDESIVAMVATFGISMSALVTIVGRNFGSITNVDVMAAAICAPLAGGMMLSGDWFLALIGGAFIPMFSTTRDMAALVRHSVQKAYSSTNEAIVLADQFETALNNMSHGLFMVDLDGRITVANRKAAELLGLADPKAFEGHTLRALLRFAANRGRLARKRATEISCQAASLLAGTSSREMMEWSGRFFDVSSTVRPGRGVVLNFEEATQRILSERKVTRLARYDSLSGLPNREWMAELLRARIESMSSSQKIVFSVFDVDRFKQINDTMGHSAGDKVIQHVGNRLNRASETDPRVIAARLGGDEFVIAVTGVGAEEDVHALLDVIYGEVTGSHLLNGKRVEVQVSGGVFVSDKQSFVLDEALVKADLALYGSKKREGTAWTIFEKDMDDSFRKKQKLTEELRRVLAFGGITAAYQPMLTADGSEVLCCEALARWIHPTMGFIPPQEFIGIAEEIGVVSQITKQILRTACRDCMTWPTMMSVSVNLSVMDLSNLDIVHVIRDALDESGLPPQRLQIEITETVLVKDIQKARSVMAAIRAMGVKTALDDFGTGYSSLSYLHEFPIDKVKIDRSFVQRITSDPKAAQLLGAMIRLTEELGFDVVVEGIESTEQLAMVTAMGSVSLVQGWVFGRPMATDAIPGFVLGVTARKVAHADSNVVRLHRHRSA